VRDESFNRPGGRFSRRDCRGGNPAALAAVGAGTGFGLVRRTSAHTSRVASCGGRVALVARGDRRWSVGCTVKLSYIVRRSVWVGELNSVVWIVLVTLHGRRRIPRTVSPDTKRDTPQIDAVAGLAAYFPVHAQGFLMCVDQFVYRHENRRFSKLPKNKEPLAEHKANGSHPTLIDVPPDYDGAGVGSIGGYSASFGIGMVGHSVSSDFHRRSPGAIRSVKSMPSK
jgi:hypothetical protein